MRIVETDNFGSDYPNESFLNLSRIYDKDKAQTIANAINNAYQLNCSRYWKVVEDDYRLKPGFEP